MKKSRHRAALPPWHTPRPVVLDEAYEREVQRSTEKLEREYRRAEKRAAAAEIRLERARAANHKRQRLAELERLVEQRRAELEDFRKLMQRSAGRQRAVHRTGRDERLEFTCEPKGEL